MARVFTTPVLTYRAGNAFAGNHSDKHHWPDHHWSACTYGLQKLFNYDPPPGAKFRIEIARVNQPDWTAIKLIHNPTRWIQLVETGEKFSAITFGPALAKAIPGLMRNDTLWMRVVPVDYGVVPVRIPVVPVRIPLSANGQAGTVQSTLNDCNLICSYWAEQLFPSFGQYTTFEVALNAQGIPGWYPVVLHGPDDVGYSPLTIGATKVNDSFANGIAETVQEVLNLSDPPTSFWVKFPYGTNLNAIKT